MFLHECILFKVGLIQSDYIEAELKILQLESAWLGLITTLQYLQGALCEFTNFSKQLHNRTNSSVRTAVI